MMPLRLFTRSLAVVGICAISVTQATPGLAEQKAGVPKLGWVEQSFKARPSKGTPAMRWGVEDLFQFYVEGGWDRSFGGAQHAAPSGLWAYKSQKQTATGVVVDYTGAVNAMAYCIDDSGKHLPEIRGNCQDDITIADPTVAIDFDKKVASLTATVLYRDKITHKYIGPQRIKWGVFDYKEANANIPKQWQGGLDYHTANGITTVSVGGGPKTAAAQKVVPSRESKNFEAFSFSFPSTVDREGGKDKPQPVLLEPYKKSDGTSISYPEAGVVKVGETKTLSPVVKAPSWNPGVFKDVTYSRLRYSSPAFFVNSKTGEVTIRPTEKDQRFGSDQIIRGGVEAKFSDGSVRVGEVSFTLPAKGTRADTFAPGAGTKKGNGDELEAPAEHVLEANKVELIDPARGPFTARLQPSGKGLIFANMEAAAILEAGPYGYHGGYGTNKGLDAEAKIALFPQASKFYSSDNDSLNAFASAGYRCDFIRVYKASGRITGLTSNATFDSLGFIVRHKDGSARFVVLDNDEDVDEDAINKYLANPSAYPDFDMCKRQKVPLGEFTLPHDLFGGHLPNNFWGEEKTNGWADDLLPLSDGRYLWIRDVPLKGSSGSAEPVLIDPVAKTATVAEGFAAQFKGKRDLSSSLHGAIQGDRLVVYNQVTARSDDRESADPQSVGVYEYQPATGSFKALGPVGAIKGVSAIVAATFDGSGNPVFIDNQNYLTVVDPVTRKVIRGGKPFHGLERLASLNRRILLRKGDWYHTVGEGKDGIAVIEAAQPAGGPAEEVRELSEAERYEATVRTPGAASVGSAARSDGATFFVGEGPKKKAVESPVGVRFALSEGADERFKVDSANGSVSFTPTVADLKAGSVSVPVEARYADGSKEELSVTFAVSKKPTGGTGGATKPTDKPTPPPTNAPPTTSPNPQDTPKRDGGSSGSSSKSGSAVAGIGGLIAFLGLIAALVGSGAVKIPGLPPLPGLPGFPALMQR